MPAGAMNAALEVLVAGGRVLALTWLAWCALRVVAQVLAPLFYRPNRNAYTNGLVVYVGPSLRAGLAADELAAVVAHERGHLAHGHAWRNLARSCLFLRSSEARDFLQECEADDYAAARGHADALSRALRRVSPSTVDRRRAGRLDRYVRRAAAG